MPTPSRLDQLRQHLAAGRGEAAKSAAQRLLAGDSRCREAAEAMHALLAAEGQWPAAIYYAERLTREHPGDATTHLNLATTLLRAYRLVDAEVIARAAAARFPDDPRPLVSLATALYEQGRAADAHAVLTDLARRAPDDPSIASMLAMTTTYLSPADPRALLEAHRNLARTLDDADPAQPLTHAPSRPPPPPAGRRVRLGFISGDFKQHSCTSFFEPLLDRLDRARFEPFLYMTDPAHDAVTTRLRALAVRDDQSGAGTWRDVHHLSDHDLARAIHADDLDLLIDLAGATPGHRLGALRLKPARRIATYLGHPATTGLEAIDFRLVDSITDPPGAEAFATEQLIRLDPCFLCYRPPADAPPPSAAPFIARGHVTFGSFNSRMKINRDVIALWSRLLATIPGSRLLIKAVALRDPKVAAHLLAEFRAAGVDPARLEILSPTAAIRDHLAAYARVDIALDTFPYHGTTTTFEALHMGVPVVTLALPGPAAPHLHRVSASILTTLGATELIADNEDGYLRAAAALADAAARLTELHRTLRDRLAASPPCDETAFARRFASAVERMIN